jgi:hypothetical protein
MGSVTFRSIALVELHNARDFMQFVRNYYDTLQSNFWQLDTLEEQCPADFTWLEL